MDILLTGKYLIKQSCFGLNIPESKIISLEMIVSSRFVGGALCNKKTDVYLSMNKLCD